MIKKDEIANFLNKSGLLFEINREVLHPMGLALAIKCDVDEQGNEIPDTAEFLGITETDNKTGFVFDSESWEHGLVKINQFLEERDMLHRDDARMERYGFIIQDVVVK